MSRAIKSALIGMAAASMFFGGYPSYLDMDLWRGPIDGVWKKSKDRTAQWAGHRNKALALRRKHNKMAKQARKRQRRK